MNVFFRPAVMLMNKLKYPKKLFLLGGIGFIAIAILTYQLVNQSLTILDFSNKEVLGVQYIDPVIKVMQNVQRYRQLENKMLLGDQTVKDKLIATRDDVDNYILLVDEQERTLGSTLKTTETWNKIKNKWQTIKSQSIKDPTNSNFSDTTALIGSIQTLIISACDTSNLTLDPDIDTYYLMDSYCTKIPSFGEEVAMMNDIGYKALSTKTLSAEDRETLVINKTLMDKFHKVSIKNNLNKILQVKPYLSPKFDTLIQQIYLESSDLTQLLDATVLAGNFNMPPASYAEKFNSLFDLNYQFYGATGSSLKTLLQARVDSILNSLYVNIALVVITTLLLIYLFVAVYLSIVNSIKSLVRGSEELAGGDLNTTVTLETQDELVQVAASFNTMRDTLSKLIIELHSVVKSAVQGDLSKRINLADKEGFYHELSMVINQMSEAFQMVINEMIHVLNSMSKGILTEKITYDYKGSFGDLKKYSNITAISLEKLIKDIKIATETINHAAKEIAIGNNDLAKRTEQQAAFLEETSTSIEEVTATVKQNADHAQQANQLAKSASDVATKGGAVVGEVIQTMNDINESSRKVADIISVIDDIAFQTNILALNAAVEAARAGEQGRGFAVVASEVRNLAQRTSLAAKEIKMLISKSVENVASGSKLVDQAGQTMEEIVKAVKRVTEIMAEIATASIEQSSGIDQVNQAITQMDQVIQQNTALVEEAAAASESMETQTIHMDNLVSVFKLSPSSEETISSNVASQKSNIPHAHNVNASSKEKKKDDAKSNIDYQKNKHINWEEF